MSYAGLHRQRARLAAVSGSPLSVASSAPRSPAFGTPQTGSRSLGGLAGESPCGPSTSNSENHSMQPGQVSGSALADLRSTLELHLQRAARAESRTAALESKVLELAELLLSTQKTSEEMLEQQLRGGESLRTDLLAVQQRVAAFEAQLNGAVRALADAAAQRRSRPAALPGDTVAASASAAVAAQSDSHAACSYAGSSSPSERLLQKPARGGSEGARQAACEPPEAAPHPSPRLGEGSEGGRGGHGHSMADPSPHPRGDEAVVAVAVPDPKLQGDELAGASACYTGPSPTGKSSRPASWLAAAACDTGICSTDVQQTGAGGELLLAQEGEAWGAPPDLQPRMDGAKPGDGHFPAVWLHADCSQGSSSGNPRAAANAGEGGASRAACEPSTAGLAPAMAPPASVNAAALGPSTQRPGAEPASHNGGSSAAAVPAAAAAAAAVRSLWGGSGACNAAPADSGAASPPRSVGSPACMAGGRSMPHPPSSNRPHSGAASPPHSVGSPACMADGRSVPRPPSSSRPHPSSVLHALELLAEQPPATAPLQPLPRTLLASAAAAGHVTGSWQPPATAPLWLPSTPLASPAAAGGATGGWQPAVAEQQDEEQSPAPRVPSWGEGGASAAAAGGRHAKWAEVLSQPSPLRELSSNGLSSRGLHGAPGMHRPGASPGHTASSAFATPPPNKQSAGAIGAAIQPSNGGASAARRERFQRLQQQLGALT